MAGKILQAAVVGASTLLGKELVQEITGSAASAWDLRLLEDAPDVEGQLTSAGDEALVIHSLGDSSLEGMDVVFFASSPALTERYAEAALRSGAAVIDLTGALAGQQGFLVRSPWVSEGTRPDLTTLGIATPHPAALVLALVVSRLAGAMKIRSTVATLLQPASEAGAAGLDELHQQTVNLLSFQEVPKEVYGTQVAFTLQPVLGEEAAVDLGAVRARVRRDLDLLLGAEVAGSVYVSVLQAPVFHGYVASVFVQLQAPGKPEAVRAALAGAPVSADADLIPSNQAAAESGELLVRVEAADGVAGDGFWLVLAVDNLRFAARNALEAALELLALRPGARVQ